MVQAQQLDVIRIFRIPFSTNVERVALAAGHKGIPIEWIDIDPDDRSPVERASGQVLVPVLLHGDEVVTDSPKIIAWLEERVPEPSLYPADPARRAEVAIFVQWFNGVWKAAPNQIADGDDDPALAAELGAAVGLFEALLERRDYLFGEFGAADVFAFPFLKYGAFGAPEDDTDPFHQVLVDHQPLRPGSPIRAWAERVDAHARS